MLSPIHVLEQREDFLEGIKEIARLCYWSEGDIAELTSQLWNELVAIDNEMYFLYDKTRNRELAHQTWEGRTEDLRRWLSLILGIKIKYV